MTANLARIVAGRVSQKTANSSRSVAASKVEFKTAIHAAEDVVDPRSAPLPLVRLGPGGDFVKDYTPTEDARP